MIPVYGILEKYPAGYTTSDSLRSTPQVHHLIAFRISYLCNSYLKKLNRNKKKFI